MPPLPPVTSPEEFDRLDRGDPRVRAAARHLSERHGAGPVALVASGSLPVFHAGERQVLKLYPPCFAHEGLREQRVLETARGAVPCTIPAVEASGELDGWRYLLMERVPGVAAAEVWTGLTSTERRAVAAQTGEVLAALHRIGPDRSAPLTLRAGPEVPPSEGEHGSLDALDAASEWTRFVRGQREACVDHHRARGAEPAWLEQIPAFLASAGVPDRATPVLLHTEIMREHVFVAPGPAGWRVTGLVDFEPAMWGAAEYEFASVGVYFAGGDGPALRALLLGYGLRADDLGHDLQRRLLAYALLHRYSSLPRFLQRAPVPSSVRTLDALARCWWAFDEAAPP